VAEVKFAGGDPKDWSSDEEGEEQREEGKDAEMEDES